jgi:hypothetical protein
LSNEYFHRKLSFCDDPSSGAKLTSECWVADQAFDGCCGAIAVSCRDQQAIFLVMHNLSASWHVGCDDSAPDSSGLDQDPWQAFAVRRHTHNIGLRQRFWHVLGESLPGQYPFLFPGTNARLPYVGRVVRIGASNEKEVCDVVVLAGGRNKFVHAFVTQDTRRKNDNRFSLWLGALPKVRHVDATATDHDRDGGVDEIIVTKKSEIVGVLKNGDSVSVAEREAVEAFDDGALQACRKSLNEE